MAPPNNPPLPMSNAINPISICPLGTVFSLEYLYMYDTSTYIWRIRASTLLTPPYPTSYTCHISTYVHTSYTQNIYTPVGNPSALECHTTAYTRILIVDIFHSFVFLVFETQKKTQCELLVNESTRETGYEKKNRLKVRAVPVALILMGSRQNSHAGFVYI